MEMAHLNGAFVKHAYKSNSGSVQQVPDQTRWNRKQSGGMLCFSEVGCYKVS